MPKLEIDTPAIVSQLLSGDTLVALAPSPELVSFGDEEEALLAARVFLSEHLSQAAPGEVARFALPEGTRLHHTDVLVPREDLPRRCPVETPVAVTSLVIPTLPNTRGVRDSWVMVLRPHHTFFVPANEAIDEAIEHEVKRLCAALEMTPAQYLSLLPPREETLVSLRVAFERGVPESASRAADGRRRLAEKEAIKSAIAVLDSVAEPLFTTSGQERPFPLRASERDLLGRLLGGDERQSALIVGPSRVGKTGLFRAWLERERLEGRTRLVYATSGARLIAGMSGFGQWQERVRRVMEAASTLDALLYFDDFADLFSDRPGSTVDIPSAMRPWLESARVRVVGEVQSDTLERIEARNVAFFSCFGRVRLEPLSEAQARQILIELGSHDSLKKSPLPSLEPEAIDAIVELARRYLPYESFPGKAVRLANEIRAAAEAAQGSQAPGARIGASEVHSWFSSRTGIPEFLLQDERELRVAHTIAELRRRVIGQDEAVRRIAELVSVVKAGLGPSGKPLATLLFVGPTGVGKTELARALAELLFGSEDRLVRIDMSEYADPLAADRLFRGGEGGEGLLTRKVREQPFSVVLLDEIEKAHGGVFDLLLQVCGEGRLTDGRGKTAYFHNTFIIMTSNLGAAQRRAVAGFGARPRGAEEHYLKVVDQTFRPELVNRIDRIIAFRPLERGEIRAVTDIARARAARRRGLTQRGIDLVVSEEALEHLASEGMSEAYGARALRRHVERALLTPVARLISGRGADIDGEKIVVVPEGAPLSPKEEPGLTEGGLRFGVVRVPSRRGSDAHHDLSSIMSCRREMNAYRDLPRIEQLDEQVAYLVAQLGYGRDRKKRVEGEELAQMQSEHHQLSLFKEDMERSYDEICSIEELALTGFLSGEGIESLQAEVKAVRDRFRATLVRALVADDKRRNAATLMLLELDTHRAFDLWLAPLLRDLDRRGWTAQIHVDGGDRENAPAWPSHRRWGPPRDAAWILDRLQLQERPFRSLLLRIEGDHAGIWLALEAGLHRFPGFGNASDKAEMHVTLVARRSGLGDEEWTPPRMDPPGPTVVSELGRQAPIRRHDPRNETLTICGMRSIFMTPAEYWPRFEEIALEHLLMFERKELPKERESALRPLFDDSFAEVLRHLREGQKIMAIKVYRQLTGCSLLEAKNAVEAMR